MLDLVGYRTGDYRISGGPAPESMEANARPPIMAHAPAPLGFAWLWFIEQKKRGKKAEALSKRRSSDSAQAGFEGRCAWRQKLFTSLS
jgi:hypothetical protein